MDPTRSTGGWGFIGWVVPRPFRGGPPAAVGALVASEAVVMSDEVGLVCVIGHLVAGDQTSGPGVGTLFERQPGHLLFGRVLVSADLVGPLVAVETEFRLLLLQVLIHGLFRAGSDRRRPVFRGDNPAVQRVVAGCAVQRVGPVEHLVVLKIGGLVAPVVCHYLSSHVVDASGGPQGRASGIGAPAPSSRATFQNARTLALTGSVSIPSTL